MPASRYCAGKRRRGIDHVAGLHVFDAAAGRQAVLRQADAAAAQIGADLLVLRAVEAVPFEQRGQALRGVRCIVRGARQQVVEQVLHHAG